MPVSNKNSQSQKSILTSCDQCKNEFQLSKFKTVNVTKDIRHTFFNCPSCGYTYTCYYTDEHIRVMQAKLREVQRKQSHRPTVSMVKQANELHQSIKQAMQLLRIRVETHDE